MTSIILRIRTLLGTALAAAALVLAAPLAWAQAAAAKNAVESINFSSVQGGKIVVKVGLKEALKGDNADAIQAKTNALAQASMKLGEAMYKQQQEGQPGEGGPGAAPGGEPGKKEDVVDAEFTEVDDDKKKSA